jgi:hypothetical protein
MICHCDANACEELDDIDPVTFAAGHKSHVSKVVATAVVGFAFEDSMDNGDAMKIGFYCLQTFKVAWKMQWESMRMKFGLQPMMYGINFQVVRLHLGMCRPIGLHKK